MCTGNPNINTLHPACALVQESKAVGGGHGLPILHTGPMGAFNTRKGAAAIGCSGRSLVIGYLTL